jgi:hypothetical protein
MASLDKQVRTFEDLMSHLIRGEQSGSRAKQQEWVKEACQGAYNSVCFQHEWDYYLKEYRIHIDAPYSTGTITYDHTGGASERLLTLASGTWPSWAKYGRVRISNYIHDVYDRLSDTTLQLHDNINPGEDIAAGTSYSIYRNHYPLPEDFLSMYWPCLENTIWKSWYITPSEWVQRERFVRASGTPVAWTIMANPDKTTDFAIILDPPPDAAQPFSFLYRRRPRTIRWSGIEDQAINPTLSGSAAASTLTTSTTLPSSMVGSILRISGSILSSTTPPTGLGGSNPFEEQHRIKSISTTTVTLDGTTLDNAYSAGTAMLVSDPIDISHEMLDALLAECRSNMAEFGAPLEEIKLRREIADRKIRTAMEGQTRYDARSRRGITSREYFNQATVTLDES